MTFTLRRGLQIGVPVVAFLLIAWLCIFKSGDGDFFWHIKAGQLMGETGGIIHTDPFAYTRVGQPYLATHEWLAQIILAFFFDVGGATGVLLLRLALVLGSFALLLTIDFKRSWINVLLLPFAAASMRSALADRPQLFTFLFTVITIVLCIQYLQIESTRRRRRILYFFPVVILLWSNLHGAASILGLFIIGALFFQRLWSLFRAHTLWPLTPRNEVLWFLGSLALSFIALLLTPSGFGNISYLLSLANDRTAEFISEWQPNIWSIYLLRTWYIWALAIGSLIIGRKNMVFSVLLLLGMGYLSRSAVRHEPLLILAGIAITFHQLRSSDWYESLLHFLQTKIIWTISGIAVLLLSAGIFVHRVSYDTNRQYQLYGTGLFEAGKSAVDFIEENKITGNVFNSYEIGGYMLYRDQKVFLDGRNVDYGYDYIKAAMDAKKNPSAFYQLTQKYNFSHAVIFYGNQLMEKPLPYAGHLYANPEWVLVYLDDWVAVFARNTGENQDLIAQFGYTMISPEKLDDQAIPPELTLTDFERLQSELQRVINSSPEGIKGHLHLAKLAMMLEQYQAARSLLEKAVERQPHNHRSYLLLAQLAVEEGNWDEAEIQLDLALEKAGYSHTTFDEEFVRTIRENAAAS